MLTLNLPKPKLFFVCFPNRCTNECEYTPSKGNKPPLQACSHSEASLPKFRGKEQIINFEKKVQKSKCMIHKITCKRGIGCV